MNTHQLTERLHTWEAWHPEWRKDVRCALYLPGTAVVLVDPQIPEGAAGRELRSRLDEEVAQSGLPLHIFCTVFWHARSAPELLTRFGERAQWWFPHGERELPTGARRLRAGDELPAGLQALPTARGDEVLLWIPGERAIFAGDVVLGGEREPLELCPQSWLEDGLTRADLAESLRPALGLDVSIFHVGHGDPVTAGARDALESALARCGAQSA